MKQDFIKTFALDIHDLQLLLLFQNQLLEADIACDNKADIAQRKRDWMIEWQIQVEQHLNGDNASEMIWFEKSESYEDYLDELRKPENHIRAGVMLLPYFCTKGASFYSLLQTEPISIRPVDIILRHQA
jgi:hypothetical protein